MEAALEKILKTYREKEGNVISILQDLEETFGYIPENAVNWFSKKLDIPESRFYGITTFYAQFHLKPPGKNVIIVCRGTACHVKGSDRLISGLRRTFNLPEGEDTTADRKFTIERVACVGTCGMAPVALINKKVHGKMTSNKLIKEIKILEVKKTDTNNEG
ncbi:MAG: NAD(P)H-dependent oxidoreductase subunit E [Nitrospirota bacterium]|nr:NAD(P)H-dependent oxidoreductase subunit E [Nitrospirota bacterium]MDH5768199.1 NAD(P)H-dependent oxidoreductase subunit E [Nitrospirota bacterium]